MTAVPSSPASRHRWPRLSWIAGLLVLTAGYRLATAGSADLLNTSPLMAACFGGGLLLGWRFCWVPALLLLVGDLYLGLAHGLGWGAHTAANAAMFTLASVAGAAAGRRGPKAAGFRWLSLWLGTLSCSLLFYLAANSYVWFLSPLYEKTLAGWWQSQTIGLPQFQPQAWVFLVRSLMGDTVWCVLAAPLFCWAPVLDRRPEVSGPAAAAA